MILTRIVKFVKGPEQDLDGYKAGWDRAKSLHEIVFVTLESAIIMGAVRAALTLHPLSIGLTLIYWIAYLVTALYLMTGIRYVSALVVERLRWSVSPNSVRWAAGIISLVVPHVLSTLVSQLIELNLHP